VDAVKRVGEVGRGICGGDGAGAGAEGCYRASMDDGWRVCIAFGVLPRSLHSFRRALISALGSRLGDQVAVSSRRWGTQIFVYAPSAGSADEAAQVAREVLARHDVSAPVRIERWSSWAEEWLDATDKPSADVAAEQQAEHEYLQEQERETSVTTGRPAWAMTVELRSRRDAVALAGHLAAQGWQVRPLRKDLIVWADCEDDAKGLARALSGDGRADADTAFRVRRVSTINNAYDGYFPSSLWLIQIVWESEIVVQLQQRPAFQDATGRDPALRQPASASSIRRCRQSYAVHRDARLSWGGFPAPGPRPQLGPTRCMSSN